MIDRRKENENKVKNEIKKPKHHTITISPNEEIEKNLSLSSSSFITLLKQTLFKHKYMLFCVMFFVATFMIQITEIKKQQKLIQRLII